MGGKRFNFFSLLIKMLTNPVGQIILASLAALLGIFCVWLYNTAVETGNNMLDIYMSLADKVTDSKRDINKVLTYIKVNADGSIELTMADSLNEQMDDYLDTSGGIGVGVLPDFNNTTGAGPAGPTIAQTIPGSGGLDYASTNGWSGDLSATPLQFYDNVTAKLSATAGTNTDNNIAVINSNAYMYTYPPWPVDSTETLQLLNKPKVSAYLTQHLGEGIYSTRTAIDNYNSGAMVSKGMLCKNASLPPIVNMCSIDSNGISASFKTTEQKYKVCAVYTKDGSWYYMPVVQGDAKGHTWPGGLSQTHLANASSKLSTNQNGSTTINFTHSDTDDKLIKWSDGTQLSGTYYTFDQVKLRYQSGLYYGTGRCHPRFEIELDSATASAIKSAGYTFETFLVYY